jgi:cytochrome c
MNPCAAGEQMDSRLFKRPENYRPYRKASRSELIALGEKLFNDTTLSTNGLSCNSCHINHLLFQDTFANPYPHFVEMPSARAGVESVHLDEMIQFCMVAPMAADPLPWDGKELAALTAYVETLQSDFRPGGKNPCAAANPCGPAMVCWNPCAVGN